MPKYKVTKSFWYQEEVEADTEEEARFEGDKDITDCYLEVSDGEVEVELIT